MWDTWDSQGIKNNKHNPTKKKERKKRSKVIQKGEGYSTTLYNSIPLQA